MLILITDRQRSEAFLRRGHRATVRHGLYPADNPAVTQLIEEADESLSRNITHPSPSFPFT